MVACMLLEGLTMVENDEVIYEEIRFRKQSQQHERSYSEPVVTPYETLKRLHNTSTEPMPHVVGIDKTYSVFLDKKEQSRSNVSINGLKTFEIYEDHQPARYSTIAWVQHDNSSRMISDTTEKSNSDTSIYVKMNQDEQTYMECAPTNNLTETNHHVTDGSLMSELNHDVSQDKVPDAGSIGIRDRYLRNTFPRHAASKAVKLNENTFTPSDRLYDNCSPPRLLQQLQSEQQVQQQYLPQNVHTHLRACSSGSSTNSSIVDTSTPFVTRSAEELTRPKLKLHQEETIYAEIVTNNKDMEITTARVTRESENPILRQGAVERVKTAVKRTASLNNLDDKQCLYGEIEHSVTRRTSLKVERRRPRSMFIGRNSLPDHMYENAISPTRKEFHEHVTHKRSSSLKHRHSFETANKHWKIMEHAKEELYENNTTMNRSYYENIESTDQIYNNVSDCEADLTRERKHSRPIDILPSLRTQNDENSVDSDLRKSHPPFSCSSSSMTSSPPESCGSSMCSEVSAFAPTSVSPPPLPNTRKRLERYASWSNIYAFSGLNYFPAHYLGRLPASKVTRDFVDYAVSHVAQNTNVLEMKPVLAEVSHEFVRLGSNSSPWELLESFPMEDVICHAVILKNAYFLGIIAGRPGEECYCYVLQSDKAIEISEAIQDIFQTVTKIPRSQTFEFQQASIEPEFHRYHNIVRIGSVKLKKSFHNVNDYIKSILEKEHPKDFKAVSLEIMSQKIVVSETITEEEENHSAPSILTLGIYQHDKRYFGYIISETAPHNKTRVQCYVYRAARNEAASKIVTAITQACQNSCTPRRPSDFDINPIYSTHKAIYSSVTPVGSVKSTSSTTTSQSLPSTKGSLRNGSLSSSLASTPTSPVCLPSPTTVKQNADIVTQFLNAQEIPTKNEIHTSTETLSSLTPSPSIDLLPRSSPVATRRYCLNAEFNRSISLEGNPIYEKRGSVKSESVEPTNDIPPVSPSKSDGNKKPKHKKFLGKIKNSIRHKHVHHSEPPVPNTHVTEAAMLNYHEVTMEEIQPEVLYFDASYMISMEVSPPLKQKLIKNCYKQYSKEIQRAGKLTNNNANSFGSQVNLQVITNMGVSMLDPKRPDIVIRYFPIETYEIYAEHPEGVSCFGFSTSVPEHSKHKCHLFSIRKEVLPSVRKAFEKLSVFKSSISFT